MRLIGKINALKQLKFMRYAQKDEEKRQSKSPR